MRRLSVSIAMVVVLSLGLTPPGGQAYTDPVLDPVTLTDKHNNTADSNSDITWGPLPDGQPYMADTNVTDDAVVSNFLKLMRGFVHILQPKDVDYELVSDVIKGDTDLTTAAKSLGIFVIGFGICLVIGIIFLFCFPLVGCCFCCCRLCGNCGGKKLQKEPIKDCKCVVFSVIVNIMVTGVFMGAMMTIVMDDRLSHSFKYMTNATGVIVDDVKTFLNNTAEEVDVVALDGFNFTAEVLLRDLNNVGALLGVPVRDGLDGALAVDATVQEVINMDLKIDEVTIAMEETDSAHGNFTAAFDALELALSNLQTSLGTTLGETDCTSQPTCNSMDETTLVTNPTADPALIPSLNSSLQSLYDLQNQNITASALDGKKSFDELPERVQNETAAQITEIENMLNDFSTEIQDNLGSIDELTKNTDQLTDVKDTLTSYTDILDTYDGYRSAGFWAISLMLMVTVLFWVLGLCFGSCSYNSHTTPTERTCCCSNCAGILLMAAAGVSWMMSVLFMLFTFFPFLIGYPLEKFVCDPLTDPEYKIFKSLLDEPGGLLSADGYFMGELLFGNGSIELTLSGVLESCRNNEPAYQAMKLDNLIDLDQVTNYEDTLNITEQVEQMTVDMSTVEVISQDTIDQLNQFSAASDVNYTAMYLVLSQNLTATDLVQFHTDLTAAEASITAPSTTKTDIQGHLSTLQGIIDTEYAEALRLQSDMYNKTKTLETVGGTIPDQVNATINASETLEARIQSGYGDTVLDREIKVYADRLIGVVDSFVTYITNQLTNEMARCEPVWNVWDTLVVTGLCNYVVDTFNGFWFALGMAVFSSFFGIIFSIKLAKYYRTMKHLDGEEEEGDNEYDGNSDIEDSDNGYDDHNSHLAKKGSGPQPFATSRPFSGPKGAAMGKTGSSRPPSYNSVYPTNNSLDF